MAATAGRGRVTRVSVVLAAGINFGHFTFTGHFTAVDLVAAATNALIALIGGLGGGITRDVLVAEVPAALTNPAYIRELQALGLVVDDGGGGDDGDPPPAGAA